MGRPACPWAAQGVTLGRPGRALVPSGPCPWAARAVPLGRPGRALGPRGASHRNPVSRGKGQDYFPAKVCEGLRGRFRDPSKKFPMTLPLEQTFENNHTFSNFLKTNSDRLKILKNVFTK